MSTEHFKLILTASLKYIVLVLGAKLGFRSAMRLRMPRHNAPKYFLTAFIRIKNEARFLPELIAYHQLIGVEHFYLYNNNSDDQPEAVLKPFLDAGTVTIIPWPTVPVSPSCNQHFFQTYAHESTWVACIDADEFIVESRDGVLLEFLRRHRQWPAIALNSRMFGSNGHDRIPDGLVIEEFIRSDPADDFHVKVIAQPRRVEGYISPHNFVFSGFAAARNLRGFPVPGSRWFPPKNPRLRLNHYVYRSRQDYTAKTLVGYAEIEAFRNQARRQERTDSEFPKHNDVIDTSLQERCGVLVCERLRAMGYGPPFIRNPPDHQIDSSDQLRLTGD